MACCAASTDSVGLLSHFSLTVVFLLLYVEFKSLRPTLLVMVNLPLALVGGIGTR